VRDHNSIHVVLAEERVDVLCKLEPVSLFMFSLAIWKTCSPLTFSHVFIPERHSKALYATVAAVERPR